MKSFEIVASDKLDADIQKKIKRLLQPVLSIGQPAKCLFCDTETTWTINNKPVCPACSVKYGFMKNDRIPDPCEVCGRQGEWCTDGDPVHSLCYIHREAWFRWGRPELEFIDRKKHPEKWSEAWDEGWAKFVAFMKENR